MTSIMPHFNNFNKAALLYGLVVFVEFLLLRAETRPPGCNVVKLKDTKRPTFYIRQSPPGNMKSSTTCYLNCTHFLKQIYPPKIQSTEVLPILPIVFICLDRMRLVFNKTNSEHIVQWKSVPFGLGFSGPCIVTGKDLVTWGNSVNLLGLFIVNNSVLLDKNDTSERELSTLSQIKYLTLQNDKIKTVPAIFTQGIWPNLTRLVLWDMKMKTFPRELRYTMPNLQILSIPNAKLTKPPEFPWTLNFNASIPFSRRLLLKYNNITDLPNFTFWGVIHLISVGGNRLKTIGSKCFSGLQGTQIIDLSNNLLSYIPPTLFKNLRSLWKIYLMRNNISFLNRTTFKGLRNLTFIFLQNNLLTILQKDLMSDLRKLSVVHLENNQIRSIEDGAFPEQIQKIYLSNNYIKRFPPSMFLLGNIQTIDLSKNLITFEAFTKPLDSLNTSQLISFRKMHHLKLGQKLKEKTLNLASNRIRKLSLKNFSQSKKTNLKSVLKVFRVNLTENPILCNCETLQMAKLVREGLQNEPFPLQTISRNFDTWKCAKPAELKGSLVMLALWKKCYSKNDRQGFNFKKLVYAFIPIFCLLLLVILSLKYQGELKAYLYVRFHWHPFDSVDDSDPDKIYDAFVSYNSHDETWVYDTLRDTLENREPPYRLCLHERDFAIGASIQENIFHSVHRSKRMIMVLSQHFIRSEWCMLEFRAAHHRALQDRTRYLIIILMEDVRMSELDEELKMYMPTNTYLSVKNKWFWEKLLYALPQQPLNNSVTIQGVDDDQLLLRRP